MGRPSKPIAKNSNSKFTTRNSKQDIFSRISKVSKSKTEVKKEVTDVNKTETENPNS